MSLGRDDSYLIEVVTSELSYLQDEWDASISEESLRRNSNVLRSLLVDDGFGRAWRAAGKEREPRVEAVDLERNLAGLRSDKVRFATAGGGTSGGAAITGVLDYRDVMSPEVIRARYEAGPPGPRAFGLSEFLASPGIVVNGERVSRRHVVKYVSNKLGGTHPPDPKRGAGEDAFRLLDHVRSDPRVGGKSAVYFELVSIGQAIAGSSGARELREFPP